MGIPFPQQEATTERNLKRTEGHLDTAISKVEELQRLMRSASFFFRGQLSLMPATISVAPSVSRRGEARKPSDVRQPCSVVERMAAWTMVECCRLASLPAGLRARGRSRPMDRKMIKCLTRRVEHVAKNRRIFRAHVFSSSLAAAMATVSL